MELEQIEIVTDDRKRSRFSCDASVQVKTVDNRTVAGTLRDIGMHSLYVLASNKRNEFLIYGEKVEVKISMCSGDSTLSVETNGNITRMDDSGFVVQFRDTLRWWPVFSMFPTQTRDTQKWG